MKLKKLSLKNIRSYKDEEIIFPEGSILLAGDIGSGKTSILLALEYSLFGLQPGQRGASLLRSDSNMGEVTLEFEIDEKNIRIERKLRRNYKSVANESASITIDNERIDASLTEIKTKILELMGYPQEFIRKNNLLYRYTVYTPQEQMKQIILEETEIRRNILRNIFGIDKYRRIRENVSLLLSQLKEESKILQGEIKSLDEEKTKLESKKSSISFLETQILSKMQELEAKTNERKRIEIEATDIESRIKERMFLEKEIEKTKVIITAKYENIASIQKEIEEVEKAIAEEVEIFSQREYEELINNIKEKNSVLDHLNSRYTSILSEISSLEKHKSEALRKKERIFQIEICPTCLQDVPETYKHNILNETESIIFKAKQKTDILEKEISIIAHEIEKIKSEKRILEELKASKEILKTKQEYLEKTKQKHKAHTKSIADLNSDVSLLNKHMNALKEKMLELSKYDHLFKLKKTELEIALKEERKSDIQLAEIRKETELLKRDIFYTEETISKKELSKKSLTYLLELQDWLSISFLELIEFIERNVLLKLRQEFSNIFSKWFNMLVPQAALNVRLDESFSPIIIHRDIEMDYSFLSGGERTAIALAYRLALNQTINSILSKIKTKDIVILDEPTDGFSEFQLDKMREVLHELKIGQLIIVSHERKIESFVDNIIRIKKTGDVSSLESNHNLSLYFQNNQKT